MGSRCASNSSQLILRRLFDVVDDEGLDGAAGGFELEAELLLNCGEDVGSRIRRGGGSLVVPLSVYT